MKKLATLLFLSTALVAGSAQAHKHKHHHHNKPCKTEKRHAHSGARTHWLAGVSAGYAWRDGSFGYDSGFNQTAPLTDIATAGDFNSDSFLYGVFAGVQTVCNSWVLGAEFAIDWQPNDNDSTFGFASTSAAAPNPALGTGVVTANVERDTNFTLSARLGYALGWHNLLPYVRLGVETSRDYLRARTNLLTPSVIDPGTVAYLEGSNRSYRLVAGAGIEVPFTFINSGTSLRVEYNYSGRGEGVNANDFTHIAGLNDVVQSAHAKQHTNSVRASLAYNFL